MHTYQPLTGLHDPFVVDVNAQNYTPADLHLRVDCVPGDVLNNQDAGALCQKVATLFENQGARVTTSTGGPPDLEEIAPGEPMPPPDLTLELRGRTVHQASNPLSWAAMIVTFTLAPALTEFSFEQELTIRDGTGSLLATEELRGRVVHWYGFGSWATNQLLDVTVREEADEVVGDHAERELSADLYRQLSQAVFDAHVQWRVARAAAGSTP